MGKNTATFTYDTFTDLRLTVGDTSSSVTVLGGTALNDGRGGKFYYNSTSSLADDDLNVIKPTAITGAGRWIRTTPRVTKSDVGLSNVDNTSDVDKPVSTAQATAIANAITTSNTYTDNRISELSIVPPIKSATGTSTDTNYWSKILTIDLTGTNSSFSAVLSLSSSVGRMQSIMLTIAGLSSTSGNPPQSMCVDITSKSNTANLPLFAADSFRLINNGFGTPFELYMKKSRTFGNVTIREINRSVSNPASTFTYPAAPTWSATVPTGTYMETSRIMSMNIEGDKVTIPSQFTGIPLLYTLTSTNFSGSSITDADVDNIFFIKTQGKYFKLSQQNPVDLKAIGCGQNNSTIDDTLRIRTALLNYQDVIVRDGIYYVRNLQIPKERKFVGQYDRSIFRLYSTGNDAADSSAWIINVNGESTLVSDIRIDGQNKIGNGMLTTPTAGGQSRVIKNIIIGGFKSYIASPEGGSYGISGDKSKNDLLNGVGGNGFRCVTDTAFDEWELELDNIKVTKCEGYGINLGRISDSKINNLIVGNCCKQGIVTMSNQNIQANNWKVYKCWMANISEAYVPSLNKIIPTSNTANAAAIELTGANWQMTNIEAQENACNGIRLGTGSRSFSASSITNILVDGNGGYDGTLPEPDNLLLKRTGLYIESTYALIINGASTDFRSKMGYGRQLRSFFFATRPEFTSIPQISLSRGASYRIKNSGDGDFTPIQINLASPSNTTGFIFSSAWPYGQDAGDTAVSFGTTGKLESVNDEIFINMIVKDQWEQTAGTGTGYDDTNAGAACMITVNGITI